MRVRREDLQQGYCKIMSEKSDRLRRNEVGLDQLVLTPGMNCYIDLKRELNWIQELLDFFFLV